MKKGLKKILSLVLEAAFAIVMLPAYSFAEEAQTAEWALYIYMCGTDLETNWGCGADDLLEMIGADIPDNRKAAVFTGGTYEWDPCGDGTDCGSAYIKPSTEYNQLFLPDDDGMLDLYDFMYQAKEIDRFRTAAEEVIKALGSPTGSDKPGYDGHVTPEYYVGDTVGDGAVIYRGTGFCFNRSVGMSFFYPVAALDIPIPYVISGYLKGSGIEDSLGTYMEYLMATLEHDFPSFRAEMNTEFDKEDYTLSLSVDPKEQVSPALAVFDNETQSTPGEYYFFENDAAELDTAIA